MSQSRGRAVDRRTFVKDAALAAVAAGGFSSGVGALSVLFAQPAPGNAKPHADTGTHGLRPFNMICLGDSVMWGQGLRDSSKFSSQVKDWLQKEMPGRPINRFVYARSGATIAPAADVPDESAVQAWMNNRTLGEVPCSWPWIRRQVTIARDDLASQQGIAREWVDLVLLDGGINDVGVTTVLDPNPFGPIDAQAIRGLAIQRCGDAMRSLLPQVRNIFPNAKILVTGYFPIVSEESDLTAIGALLAVLFTPGAFLLGYPLRNRLAQQSSAWYEASNAQLKLAVAGINQKQGDIMYHTHPAAFAQIPWGPRNSYACPDSYLWLVGVPVDEVWDSRQAACRAAGVGLRPTCRDAKMGHPNPAGANVYASACIAHLRQYLPEWRGEKMMSACVEMDPIPAVGTATTLTVHATERGTSGKAVPGTVRVGTATFSTDTPVPLSLCTQKTVSTVEPSGRARGKPLRETDTVTVCTPITVSAPGYVDVVIENYLSAQLIP